MDVVYKTPSTRLQPLVLAKQKKRVDSLRSQITPDGDGFNHHPPLQVVENSSHSDSWTRPIPPTTFQFPIVPTTHRPRRISSGWSEITPEPLSMLSDWAHGQQPIALTQSEAGGQSPLDARETHVILLAEAYRRW
jgi:hypothetical protein